MSYSGVSGSMGPPGPGGVFVVSGFVDCAKDIVLRGVPGRAFVLVYPDFDGDISDPGNDVCFWGFDGFVYFRDRKFVFVGSSDKCYLLRPVCLDVRVVDVPEVGYGY
jgi:hypothetical protein